MKAIQVSYPEPKDGGPCVPAALSAILDKSFDQVNNWLIAQHARKFNYRLNRAVGGTRLLMTDVNAIGFKRIDPIRHKVSAQREFGNGGVIIRQDYMKPMTVRKFVDLHPTGTFLLSSGYHAVGLKDGVVYDVIRDSSKMRLTYVYEQIGQSIVDFDKYISPVKKEKVKVKLPKGEKGAIIRKALNENSGRTIKELMQLSGASYIYCRSNVIAHRQMINYRNQQAA